VEGLLSTTQQPKAFKTPIRDDPYSQAMAAFIKSNGGQVRFDVFAKEHLMGAKGFYSYGVDISQPGSGVPTPVQSNPEYRNLLTRAIMSYIAVYVRQNKSEFETRELIFCEVGGGSGLFKKEFMATWAIVARQHRFPSLKYISVDINPNHRRLQAAYGGEVIEGSAIATNLDPGSVDILFDEEVLDCLPFRLFHWDRRGKTLSHEAFVTAQDGEFSLVHMPLTALDKLAFHTQADLERRNYALPQYRYAPAQWDYIHESLRILKSGGLKISTDYDYGGIGMILDNSMGDIESAIRSPYRVDLTHGVDFTRLSHMANINFLHGGSVPLTKVFDGLTRGSVKLMEGVGRTLFIGKNNA
jgi:SAM-dependent MidA family methyltransferase